MWGVYSLLWECVCVTPTFILRLQILLKIQIETYVVLNISQFNFNKMYH